MACERRTASSYIFYTLSLDPLSRECFFASMNLRGKARVTDSLRFINPLSFSSLARDRAVIYRRRSQIEKKYPANIFAKNESLRLKIEFSSFDFSNSFIRSVKFKYVRVHSYIRS